MEEIIKSSVLESWPQADEAVIDALLDKAAKEDRSKIVVLDDDPTGVQTVHDVSVYTNWTAESIRQGFLEENKVFFVLTNSRGLTVEQTTEVHTEIARVTAQVSRETGIDYILVSRSDSTLRGHYPLETELLRQGTEAGTGRVVDGEILCPYFKEGGRFTLNNTHYVKYGDELIPAAQTEFARDKTFGYTHSDLREYIEEKTEGAFKAEDVVCISLEDLRAMNLDRITGQLMGVHDFGKVIVNAVSNADVKVFCIALYRALAAGRRFMYRTAAAFVKALGNISDRPLLSREEMVGTENKHGGIIVVGSHTRKTTMQLEELKKLEQIRFLEMDSDLVLQEGALEKEVERLLAEEEQLISSGVTVAVYTKRTLLTVENDTKEAALVRSVKISDAVQALVGRLNTVPGFVVAKGGITSSDVGTKALQVKRATVLGQIRPGIPVWKTGGESRFPGIPYVIFPGNVGEVETLREAVELLL